MATCIKSICHVDRQGLSLMLMLRTVFLAALAVTIPASIHAQTIPPCIVTLSYSPAQPVINQPLTVTLDLESPVPPSGNAILDGLVQLQLVPAGNQGLPLSMTFEDTGGISSSVFTPNTPGQNTLSATFTTLYSFGATSVCGDSGASTVINIAASNENNLMKGQYSFHLEGTVPSLHGLSPRGAEVGSITTDGQGNITAGVLDLNTAPLTVSAVPLTGTYSLDSLGHGSLTLVSSLGTQHLAFFVSPDEFQDDIQVSQGSLISSDGGIAGNGFFFESVDDGPYLSDHLAISLRGDSACNVSCNGGYPIFVSGLINFTVPSLDLPAFSIDEISVTPSGVNPETTQMGTLTAGDYPTGRFTMTLTNNGSDPQQPTHYVVYPAEHNNSYIMSIDPHSSYYLLSGTGAPY